MGGLGGGMGGAQDMAGMLAAMQNPQMQAAMRGIMSQPGMMENIANMNPQLRQMMDANPQIRWAWSSNRLRGCGGWSWAVITGLPAGASDASSCILQTSLRMSTCADFTYALSLDQAFIKLQSLAGP